MKKARSNGRFSIFFWLRRIFMLPIHSHPELPPAGMDTEHFRNRLIKTQQQQAKCYSSILILFNETLAVSFVVGNRRIGSLHVPLDLSLVFDGEYQFLRSAQRATAFHLLPWWFPRSNEPSNTISCYEKKPTFDRIILG